MKETEIPVELIDPALKAPRLEGAIAFMRKSHRDRLLRNQRAIARSGSNIMSG